MQSKFVTSVAILFAATVLTASAQQPPAPAARGAAGRVPTTPTTSASIVPQRSAMGRLLPGTRSSVFTTIQGNALNSTNGTLPNSIVRLRDARYGRIVDTQLTDKSGLFAFRTVDPGSYIVELIGPDQSVLAASQMLSVGAGEAVSAIVKLPFHIPSFAGVLGQSVGQAATVTSAAAASGVLSTEIAGQPTSPQK